MDVSITTLPKSEVELEIAVSVNEFKPHLEKAATTLSKKHPIKGFRPGKAPLNVAIQKYGEMAVHEEAVDSAVRDTYVRAVKQEKLTTVGQPKIEVLQLVPDNPVRYKATVAILPNIILPELTSISVTKRPVLITNADIEKALTNLQKMQPEEALVDRAATEKDKVLVDMNMLRDNVPVEGGQTTGHQIYLGEDYYIPGVREKIIGMAKGEEKTFEVSFPKENFQKHLAGHTVTCDVKVTDVYEVSYPEMNDAFAQRLGFDSLLQLRGRIRENLETEAKQKARQQEDVELLDALADKIDTEELPEILITNEAHRMVQELEHNITQQGLSFDDYLQQLKKTRDNLLLEMAPEAVRRVKVSLATRILSIQHPDVCAVDDAEVDKEITKQLKHYQDDKKLSEKIQSEESRDYVRNMLRSQKIINWMREQVQWKEAKPIKV